jgi:hypothetical protein
LRTDIAEGVAFGLGVGGGVGLGLIIYRGDVT